MPEAATRSGPASRTWLYLPFLLLGLVAAGWCGFWVYAKGRIESELDRVLAQEAGLGRRWTCAGRTIGGFPFRFEARCSAVTLEAARAGGNLTVAAGPLLVVAQIYDPRLVILQATAPATVTQPDGTRTVLRWARLESSLHFSGLAVDRLSTVVAEPLVEATATGNPPPFRAASLEVHARRNPERFASDGLTDVTLTGTAASLPALDALAGNALPADFVLEAGISRFLVFQTGFRPENIDRWRDTGGRIDVTKLRIVKGPGQFEAKGDLGLDPLRRPDGRIEASAAGIDRIAGIPVGGLGNLGGLLSGRAAPPPSGPGPQLKPLPAITLRDGRVQAGPLRVPGLQLPPLY